jgi:hypothetical protein
MRFIKCVVDAGALPYRVHGYPVEWIMPANEPIDPLKDLQADILAVRSGRMTWAHFVAAWGFDPDTQLDEIADVAQGARREKDRADSDPRRAMRRASRAPRTGGQRRHRIARKKLEMQGARKRCRCKRGSRRSVDRRDRAHRRRGVYHRRGRAPPALGRMGYRCAVR